MQSRLSSSLLACAAVLCLLACAAVAHAQDARAFSRSPLPPPTGYVNDYSNVLDAATLAEKRGFSVEGIDQRYAYHPPARTQGGPSTGTTRSGFGIGGCCVIVVVVIILISLFGGRRGRGGRGGWGGGGGGWLSALLLANVLSNAAGGRRSSSGWGGFGGGGSSGWGGGGVGG